MTVRVSRLLVLVLFTGCLHAQQDSPRGSQSLRIADILSTMPGLDNPAPTPDPQAARLTVTPLESTSPVGTESLLLATITDPDGQPRHNRRVEWRLNGAGRIVQVDEGLNGRGRKVDDHLAIGQTVLVAQTIRRDNGEEFRVQPGQSWCIVTSPAEGNSQIAVTAPEIPEKAARAVFVTKHWTEGDWRFPAPSVCPTGSRPVLVTQILRVGDRQPLAGYRVRYRTTDGVPATFLPNGSPDVVAVSDARGEARVTLVQVNSQPGVSRIAIEVYRPDSNAPNAIGILAGSGETTVEWQASQVALAINSPAAVAVGGDVPVTLTATNNGRIATRPLAIAIPLPEGMQPRFSEPLARTEGGQLVWQLPALAAGEGRAVRAVFRAPRAGLYTATATAQTADGLRSDAKATVHVASPELRVRLFGPRAAAAGERVDCEVEVANPSEAPIDNVVVRAEFDPALAHASRVNALEVKLGTLGPRETKTLPLPLTAAQSGQPRCRVTAHADGDLHSDADLTVAIVRRELWLGIGGPATRYLGRPGNWDVRVANSGELPLANVQVRVAVPEVVRVQSMDGGRREGDTIVWLVDELKPGEERKFTLSCTPTQFVQSAKLTGTATAEGIAEQRTEAALEVLGMPALRLEVVPLAATVEAGKKVVYTIRVLNQGSLAARGINLSVSGVGEPPILRPLHGTGPGVGRADGTGITFDKAPRVDPRQALTYLVEVVAEKSGDGRLRVEMTSDTAPVPVVVEEATRVLPAAQTPAATSTAPGGRQT
jgi:uncharacterized membrane protein